MPPALPAPPPQPVYILRAHSSPIHALHFTPDNTYLISGDALGNVITWHLPTRRPICIFRAHEAALLTLLTLESPRRILSHARDHAVHIWRFPEYAVLPAGASADTPGEKPELQMTLSVNALNFCRPLF